MKTKNYLYFIKKRLLYKKISLIFNILIAILSFSLFGFIVICQLSLNNYREEAYESVRGDYKQCGVASFEKILEVPKEGAGISYIKKYHKELDKKFDKYIKEIVESKEIESIGEWGLDTLEALDKDNKQIWEKILNISKQGPHICSPDEVAFEREVEAIIIPPQAFKFQKYDLYKGQEIDPEKNNKNILYLGYNFRDVEIGTKLKSSIDGKEYEVAGIFKDNSKVLDASSVLSNGGSLSCKLPLDNVMVLVPPYNREENILEPFYLFSCADGYSFNQGQDVIKNIASKYFKNEIRCSTYEERIDVALSNTDWILNNVNNISIVMNLIIFMIILVTQLLLIIQRQKELGLWLITGLSRIEIFIILLGENIVKMLISALISFFIVKNYLLDNMPGGIELFNDLQMKFETRLILSMSILLLFMSVTISLIAILFIRKKTTRELLNEN